MSKDQSTTDTLEGMMRRAHAQADASHNGVFDVSDVPTMPPLESYLRVEIELASGINVAAAIEHRPIDDRDAEKLLDAMDKWAQQANTETDVDKFARRWGAYAIVNHPDRYWFVEVWRGDKRGFYQIIQRPPWKNGGFAP